MSKEKYLGLLPEEPVLASLRARLRQFLAQPGWKSTRAALRKILTQVRAMLLDSGAHAPLRHRIAECLAGTQAAGEPRSLAQNLLKALPPEGAHPVLLDLVRFYLPPEFTFRISLIARKGEIPQAGLGAANFRLGFTSTFTSPPALGTEVQLGSNSQLMHQPTDVRVRIDKQY